MITMAEIAKLANVSQPTVSRVLNGNMNVAPEIRERVLACAREHDYQYNALAKGLQGRKTHLFGVLVTDISNSFFADLTKCIETEARRHGYSIILFNSDYNTASEREYLDVVRRYRVDGIFVVPIHENSEEWHRYAEKLDAPIVAVTRQASGLDCVYVDHEEAGEMVAGHLIQRNYGQFLFIGKEYDKKYVGFYRALSAAGKAGHVSNVVYHNDVQLRDTLRTYMPDKSRLGIFASNDIYALRVLSALHELSVPVPEKAGVIGFDDTVMGQYLEPGLSSVFQPIDQMAREAVSRLLYRIDHTGRQQLWNLPLHASLVVRQST